MIALTFFLLGTILLFWCLSKLQAPLTHQFTLLLLVLAMGLRYNVGIDYPTYEEIYNNPFSDQAIAIEPIWNFANDILRSFGFKSRVFFLLTSIVTIVGYYKCIKKISPSFYVSIILFIISGLYFESANMVRQYVAMSLLFCSFSDFIEKHWLRYLVWTAAATMFHTSVLLVIPLIILSTFHYSKWILWGVWTVSFVFGNNLLNYLISNFLPFLYEISSYQYEIDDFDSGVSSGSLKMFYNMIAIFVLVLYSKYSPINRTVFVLTNMFLLGVVIYNICYLFMPARRLYFYFFPYLIILFPYCISYFKRKGQCFLMCIFSMIFLVFLLKSNIGISYDFDFSFF